MAKIEPQRENTQLGRHLQHLKQAQTATSLRQKSAQLRLLGEGEADQTPTSNPATISGLLDGLDYCTGSPPRRRAYMQAHCDFRYASHLASYKRGRLMQRGLNKAQTCTLGRLNSRRRVIAITRFYYIEMTARYVAKAVNIFEKFH